MEVGAVKQAFNNEVILLKKKLNQAKIQIIHKLTRKAKTLTEKKVPEKLKEKFTKKAESAVKEVLIIKKIKARDVARFIVTHKGQLNEYLNRPTVDTDKACARLLLHKALQDKYKVMRERFSNISIKDLLMSRQERRKLKKEAREQQKNKKKGKDSNAPIQAEGNWDVEDINMEDNQLNSSDNDGESSADEHDVENDKHEESDESANNTVSKPNLLLKNSVNKVVDSCNKEYSESNDENESGSEIEKLKDSEKTRGYQSDSEIEKTDDESESESEEISESETVGKFVKLASSLPDNNMIINNKDAVHDIMKIKDNHTKKQVEEKHKDNNKNKNLKNKILLKKFNKETSETPQEHKVVDPFFITATGENYMSLAEARPPDEVKEEHSQGNRKYRRAVMFGHVPKPKFRRDGFNPDNNNSRFSKFDDKNHNSRGNSNSSFKSNGFDKPGHTRFDKSIESYNGGNLKDRRMDKMNVNDDSKPEKLHPSWEAKKRQSGILPFQGKKIVFDEG